VGGYPEELRTAPYEFIPDQHNGPWDLATLMALEDKANEALLRRYAHLLRGRFHDIRKGERDIENMMNNGAGSQGGGQGTGNNNNGNNNNGNNGDRPPGVDANGFSDPYYQSPYYNLKNAANDAETRLQRLLLSKLKGFRPRP